MPAVGNVRRVRGVAVGRDVITKRWAPDVSHIDVLSTLRGRKVCTGGRASRYAGRVSHS